MSSSSSALASCSAASTYRPFGDLPAELLRHIFSCLELDYPSLLAATRVSKRWNESATPSLYAQLNVGEWRFQKAQLLSKELDDRPHLRPMIRVVIARCVSVPSLTRELVADFAKNRDREMTSEPEVKAAWTTFLDEEKEDWWAEYEDTSGLTGTWDEFCVWAEDECWEAFTEGDSGFDVEAFVLKRVRGTPYGAWFGSEGWRRAMEAFARLIGRLERLEGVHLIGAFDFFDETIGDSTRRVLRGLTSATVTVMTGNTLLRYLSITSLRELNLDLQREDTIAPALTPAPSNLRRLRLSECVVLPSEQLLHLFWSAIAASPLEFLSIPTVTLHRSLQLPEPVLASFLPLLKSLKHLHITSDLVHDEPSRQLLAIFDFATSLQHLTMTINQPSELSTPRALLHHLPSTVNIVTIHLEAHQERIAMEAANLLQAHVEKCHPLRPQVELRWTVPWSSSPSLSLHDFDALQKKGLISLVMIKAGQEKRENHLERPGWWKF
ncbi:hypothetical protein MNV49_007486 [Pseudohyphozyma bogoriensis]|nr:hypothetical protein MNV49_007486 [Pseudohyphozyma bogoriensis]